MEQITQKILRVTAVLIWIVGAVVGYDAAGTTVRRSYLGCPAGLACGVCGGNVALKYRKGLRPIAGK